MNVWIARLTWVAGGWIALVSTAAAEVRLPHVFGNHMVLQRDAPVPVWGWADAGETVTVSIRGQSQTAQPEADGRWRVTLDPLAVGEPATLTVKGANTIELQDVLIGEVWVCSGQSNMEWPIRRSLDPDLESLTASHPGLRLFTVPRKASAEPQTDVDAEWTACTPRSVRDFSAVAYFFGRQLHETLGVPVGLINTSWGGTRAEAWTSAEGMASRAELQPILDTWAARIDEFQKPETQASYEQALEAWKTAAEEAKAKGEREPRKPNPPVDPTHHHDRSSTLYNGMIAPLTPFAIRGAIWYQGESNAGRAYQYRTLMPALIRSWRAAWGQGDFPFYQVQLANFMAPKDEPGDSAWAELREAQHLTAETEKNVGCACIIDLGAIKDIHPKDKQNVGKRLARLALVDLYGFAGKVTRSGPTYRSMTIENGRCILHFDNLGEGELRGLSGWYGDPLRGFAIAGADRKFVWAEAKVEGDTVVVSSESVPEPLAVRYNWADNPNGNLCNGAMLPAYPFRTDDWEGVTAKNLTP
ncbi:MAG: sialate O-acetylesterase [Planctomyces sp.]|nr:sialate O-acetylesterase [Planctomyces sp.]